MQKIDGKLPVFFIDKITQKCYIITRGVNFNTLLNLRKEAR